MRPYSRSALCVARLLAAGALVATAIASSAAMSVGASPIASPLTPTARPQAETTPPVAQPAPTLPGDGSTGESLAPCVATGHLGVYRSASGDFSLWFPPSVSDPDTIAQALDHALASARSLGLDLRSHPRPVCVVIEPFPAALAGRWGEFVEEDGGWLHLNADGQADPARMSEFLRTAAHELFHLIQSGYDPSYAMARKFSDAWLWMDEASASWFEGYAQGAMSGPSTITAPLATAPFHHGLRFDGTYVPGVYATKTDAQDHGYGSAPFIAWLAKEYGDALVGDLYQRKLTFAQPLDALADVIGGTSVVSSEWKAFMDAYGAGTIYPGSSAGAFPGTATLLTAVASSDKVKYTEPATALVGNTWKWTQPDLSAHAFQVTRVPDAAWDLPADDPAIIRVAGSPELHTTAWTFTSSSGLTLQGTLDGPGEFTVAKAGALLNDRQGLYVLVTNSRSVPPWDGSADAALSISVGRIEGTWTGTAELVHTLSDLDPSVQGSSELVCPYTGPATLEVVNGSWAITYEGDNGDTLDGARFVCGEGSRGYYIATGSYTLDPVTFSLDKAYSCDLDEFSFDGKSLSGVMHTGCGQRDVYTYKVTLGSTK
jgi:hypothetical protein